MADFVSALKADLVEQFRGKENIEGLVAVSYTHLNRKPAVRFGDDLAPHSGSGKITSGSRDVLIGG